MANNVRVHKIPIMLDKPRLLCFDLNAFCEIEERFGTVQVGLEALQNQSMRSLRTLLYLGLQHEHGDEGLTEQDVGRFLDMKGFDGLAEALSKALELSLPDVSKNN